MMLLHDLLDDAVSDVSADLPALTTASRRHGMSIRRRRRALAAVGSVAAAALVGASVYALAPGSRGTDPTIATDTARIAPPVAAWPLSGQTAPSTGRGVAAALAAAVGDVTNRQGTFGRFQGEASDGDGFAALLFRPADASGPAGQVMVNLQPLADSVGPPPYTCAGDLYAAMKDCTVRRLSDGDTVRTYREDDDTEHGRGSQRLVAEVLSPARDLRVVLNAMNTNPWAGGEMRPAPVLTVAQLTAIASQPWWDLDRLPREYVDAGAKLPDYADADADES